MPELVIVTGMSGAGRTEAMHAFEDLGLLLRGQPAREPYRQPARVNRHARPAR